MDRYRAERFALFDVDLDDPSVGTSTHPHDELIDAAGNIRSHWSELATAYSLVGDEGLARSGTRLRTMVADEGITYNVTGDQMSDPAQTARIWQLDSVPLILDDADWADVEAAVAQRARLLDALLTDIYGDRRTIADGLVPAEMVFGHPGYIRKAGRVATAGSHTLFLHAADIGRRPDGSFVLWGDYTQAPSGIGYAIADRRLSSRNLSGLFGAVGPRPITTFAGTLRLALFDHAPGGVDDPTVVVLSPGSLSETAFDQAYLASMLGFPLVEAADLLVRNGAVFMRLLGSLKRVDVILRRVDSQFCDPLDLRTDSRLGVVGLVEAIARGNVSVVNTLGSGVLENPALHTVMGRLAPALIDEPLILPTVETYWGGDDLQRSELMARTSELVFDNVRTGEHLLGHHLTTAQADALRARLAEQTWQWVGRRPEHWSVAPSMTPAFAGAVGRLRAAPVALRTFAVARTGGYSVMPGGLGMVLGAGADGAAMGAIAAKDVWITSTEPIGDGSRVTESSGRIEAVAIDVGLGDPNHSAQSPRVLADLFWLGRYGERAELTVRMVAVARERFQARDSRRPRQGDALGVYLSGVAEATTMTAHLGLTTGEPIEQVMPTLVRLTMSRSAPGSVAHAVDRLVAAARAVRDQMSTSTWMVLGTIERALADLAHSVVADTMDRSASYGTDPGIGESATDLDRVDVGELARAHEGMLHGLLALAGLQAESMVHDPGWMFMDIGRRLERAIALAEMTRAVLVPRHDPEIEQGLLEAFLMANESSVIYRRRNRGLMRLRPVIMLSMFDDSNPRSMIYQLTLLRSDLSGLPDAIRTAAAERIVEDLISELRRVDLGDLVKPADTGRREELSTLMQTIASGAREVSDVLNRTRFAPPRDLRPLWGARTALP
ncbi:circularly permuted type 2 ATP-grasp protein [Williamsia sp. CHRR-6]|nr:circularly permuted type 2 ATP-grasp protein [Williamsia sp. CHRR-6]